MKKVYTHTFSDEREKVDMVIDNYFEDMIGNNAEIFNMKKYKAWLMLYEKEDNKVYLDEFKSLCNMKCNTKNKSLDKSRLLKWS